MNEVSNSKKLVVVLVFFLISIPLGQALGAMIFTALSGNELDFSPLLLMRLFQEVGLNEFWHTLWGFKVGVAVSVLIPLAILILTSVALFKPKQRALHGDARFANIMEIRKSGLLDTKHDKPDILIGQFKGQYLRWSGNSFAFLAAPTRSGKGVGIVIPNCLHYRDSMVIFDPKLENFTLTAAYRKKCGQKVFLFNPSTKTLESHHWNPLTYVSRNPLYSTGDAFNIAQILYNSSDSDSGNSKFFSEMSQKLFVGLVLYMVETERFTKITPTITYLQQLTTPTNGQSLQEWIVEQCSEESATFDLSQSCKTNLMSFGSQKAEQTASGILAGLVAPLSVFSDPLVSEMTSSDDFDFRDLRKQRMTIYLGINPDDLEKYERLINLFFSQIINVNIGLGLPENNPELKYQVLLLLDEFFALGKVNIITKGSAYIAGYGLRLLVIFQNLSQLSLLYTKDGARSLTTNFDCQIIYPPRDKEDADEYSEILGYETVQSSSKNKDKGMGGVKSESISDQKRALLMPQELMTMDPKFSIISMRGMRPIKCEKIIYYKDENFTKRIDTEHLPAVPFLGKLYDEYIAGSDGAFKTPYVEAAAQRYKEQKAEQAKAQKGNDPNAAEEQNYSTQDLLDIQLVAMCLTPPYDKELVKELIKCLKEEYGITVTEEFLLAFVPD